MAGGIGISDFMSTYYGGQNDLKVNETKVGFGGLGSPSIYGESRAGKAKGTGATAKYEQYDLKTPVNHGGAGFYKDGEVVGSKFDMYM